MVLIYYKIEEVDRFGPAYGFDRIGGDFSLTQLERKEVPLTYIPSQFQMDTFIRDEKELKGNDFCVRYMRSNPDCKFLGKNKEFGKNCGVIIKRTRAPICGLAEVGFGGAVSWNADNPFENESQESIASYIINIRVRVKIDGKEDEIFLEDVKVFGKEGRAGNPTMMIFDDRFPSLKYWVCFIQKFTGYNNKPVYTVGRPLDLVEIQSIIRSSQIKKNAPEEYLKLMSEATPQKILGVIEK